MFLFELHTVLLAEIFTLTNLIIFIVSVIVAAVATVLLAPSSNSTQEDGPDPASLDDFQIPTAEEDRVEPTLYGTRLVAAPNCVWYGNLFSVPIEIKIKAGKKSKKQEVGFAYFIALLYVIGKGRIKLIDFRMNREQSFEEDDELGEDGLLGIPQGDIGNPGTNSIELAQFFPVTGKSAASNGSGNSRSSMFILTGNHTDDGGLDDVDNTAFSTYKGSNNTEIIHKDRGMIVGSGIFIGDNTTAVPPYSYVCSRLKYVLDPLGDDLLPGAVIADLDTNAAHVIYDILNRELQIPQARIEIAEGVPGSFYDAAQTLADEELGISFNMEQPRTAENWIQDVLRHVDGAVFFNRQTGKYNMKLIRDDYDPETLNLVDDSFYKDFQLNRVGWDDTFTDIEVRWTSRTTWLERTANFVNDASRRNLKYKKKRIYAFPMFTTQKAIGNTVARLKKRAFFPYANLRFVMSIKKYRDTYGVDLNPGDVIRVDAPGLDAENFIIRITSVGGSTSADQKIVVEGAEDIFGFGNVEIEDIPDGEYTPPIYDFGDEPPCDAAVRDAVAELTDPIEDDAFNMIMVAAAPPDVPNVIVNSCRFDIDDDIIGQQQFNGVAYTASLFSVVPNTRYWSSPDLSVVFWGRDYDGGDPNFIPPKNIQQFIRGPGDLATDGEKQRMDLVCIFDGGGNDVEIVAFQHLIALPSLQDQQFYFAFGGSIRGCSATEIQSWPTESKAWFVPGGAVGSKSYQTLLQNMVVSFRAINPFQTSEPLDVVHAHTQRAQTPYPPFNLKATRDDATTVRLTWRGRTRRAGATHVDPESITAIDDLWEGVMEITASDGFGPVTVEPNTTRDADGFLEIDTYIRAGAPVGVHTYTLRTLLNGRYSAPQVITAEPF